jgi:hypothetical protein
LQQNATSCETSQVNEGHGVGGGSKGWLVLNRHFTQRRFAQSINRWKPGLSWHLADGKIGRRPMANHSVKLRVTPFLRIECKFWLTDDGWNGSCEQPSITVQAGSFEHAKSEMEMALGKYIESLLREAQPSSTGQAA